MHALFTLPKDLYWPFVACLPVRAVEFHLLGRELQSILRRRGRSGRIGIGLLRSPGADGPAVELAPVFDGRRGAADPAGRLATGPATRSQRDSGGDGPAARHRRRRALRAHLASLLSLQHLPPLRLRRRGSRDRRPALGSRPHARLGRGAVPGPDARGPVPAAGGGGPVPAGGARGPPARAARAHGSVLPPRPPAPPRGSA